MFLGLTLGVLGLAEVLAPRPVVDFWMNLATEGGEEVTLKSWVYTAARIEGIVILLWLLARARANGTDED